LAECRTAIYKRYAKVHRVVVEECSENSLTTNDSFSNLTSLADNNDVKTLVVLESNDKVSMDDNIWPVSYPKYVTLDLGVGPKKFILDTGCDMTILSPEYLNDTNQSSNCGVARSQSAFGHLVEASVVKVPARLSSHGIEQDLLFVSLTCAVTDQLKQDVGLLSLHNYEMLLNSEHVYNVDAYTINMHQLAA